MGIAEVVDYAKPCMMAEDDLKQLHRAMLEHDFEKAIEHGLAALADVKLTINAVRHAQETKR